MPLAVGIKTVRGILPLKSLKELMLLKLFLAVLSITTEIII